MATRKERSEERINERRPVRHSDMRIAWVKERVNIPDVQLGRIFMDKDSC